MAKTDTTKTAAEAETTAPAAERPRLGTIANFIVSEGLMLRNSETGAIFEAGVPTLQAVTTTTLRRLDDGDLRLA